MNEKKTTLGRELKALNGKKKKKKEMTLGHK